MKLCQFYRSGTIHVGQYLNESMLGDLSEALATDRPLLDFLTDPALARTAVRHDWTAIPGAVVPTDGIRWALPIADPPKIIGLGLNYARHVDESPYARPEHPVYFLRLSHTLVPHREPLKIPRHWPTLDYEGELAVIVGEDAGPFPKAGSVAVAGYSAFNDASVRSLQFRGPQWILGKNCPATGGFGPWVVTPDELPDGPGHLMVQTRINEEVVQHGDTRDMIFSLEDILADLLRVMPLRRGDVILTGTPEGVGFAQKPPRYLTPGDLVRVRIEPIGELINPVCWSDA